jgi:hypothetical protein
MYMVSKNTKIITIFLQKVGSLLLKFTMLLLLILFEIALKDTTSSFIFSQVRVASDNFGCYSLNAQY